MKKCLIGATIFCVLLLCPFLDTPHAWGQDSKASHGEEEFGTSFVNSYPIVLPKDYNEPGEKTFKWSIEEKSVAKISLNLPYDTEISDVSSKNWSKIQSLSHNRIPYDLLSSRKGGKKIQYSGSGIFVSACEKHYLVTPKEIIGSYEELQRSGALAGYVGRDIDGEPDTAVKFSLDDVDGIDLWAGPEEQNLFVSTVHHFSAIELSHISEEKLSNRVINLDHLAENQLTLIDDFSSIRFLIVGHPGGKPLQVTFAKLFERPRENGVVRPFIHEVEWASLASGSLVSFEVEKNDRTHKILYGMYRYAGPSKADFRDHVISFSEIREDLCSSH